MRIFMYFSLCCILILKVAANLPCAGGLGILGEDRESCCPKACIECGGEGCSSRPGGSSNCCSNTFKSQSKNCGVPPCIEDGNPLILGNEALKRNAIEKAALIVQCSELGGISSEDGLTCCAAECDECGGDDCADSLFDDYDACCPDGIFKKEYFCSEDDPPCIFNEYKINICDYLGGVLSSDGMVCCAASCGSCNQDQCSSGASECCIDDILDEGALCSCGILPCIVDESVLISKTRYVRMGLFAGSNPPGEREAEYGIGKIFDDRLIFQPVRSLDYTKIEDIINDGRLPILNMEFFYETDEAVLSKIIGGEFDADLKAFAAQCAAGGHEFWIRTLHEYNGDWYQWGLLYRKNGIYSNTVEDYAAAFQRVINIFKDAGAPVKFQLNINNFNGLDRPTPFADIWPTISGLSAVAITAYNRAYSTPNHQFTLTFAEAFKGAYDQIVELSDLPIWVAETATTSYGTDKPAWILDTYYQIAVNFPRVEQFTWFMGNKEEEGVYLDWDLNTDEDVNAFIEGYFSMRNLTS